MRKYAYRWRKHGRYSAYSMAEAAAQAHHRTASASGMTARQHTQKTSAKMQITVIKVGGAVVEDEKQLSGLIESFARIEGPKVLVHGGGRRATKVAAQLGIETQMAGGRRITDAAMLDVVTMVYGGLVNKQLVAMLQAQGVNAAGLTGADMDIIRSHRRPLKRMTIDGEERMIDFGFVGDVDHADGQRLTMLLENGIIPVVAPLTHDGKGNILNTNADTMASETAKALASEGHDVTLIFSFEKRGVLADPDDDNTLIPVITPELFSRYRDDGTISGGMLPKIENALQAVSAGVRRVVITLAENISQPDSGTQIRL